MRNVKKILFYIFVFTLILSYNLFNKRSNIYSYLSHSEKVSLLGTRVLIFSIISTIFYLIMDKFFKKHD